MANTKKEAKHLLCPHCGKKNPAEFNIQPEGVPWKRQCSSCGKVFDEHESRRLPVITN